MIAVTARRERWQRAYLFRNHGDAHAWRLDGERHGELCMAEGAGATPDDAVADALRGLGLPRDTDLRTIPFDQEANP